MNKFERAYPKLRDEYKRLRSIIIETLEITNGSICAPGGNFIEHGKAGGGYVLMDGLPCYLNYDGGYNVWIGEDTQSNHTEALEALAVLVGHMRKEE